MAVGEKDPMAFPNAPFDESLRDRCLALTKCHDTESILHLHLDGEFPQRLCRIDAGRENEDQRREGR